MIIDRLDCFYNAVHKEIVLYLSENSNQPDRVRFTKQMLYDGDRTEDENTADFIEWTGRRNSKYGKLARDMTDVGLLVVGALEVLGGKNNTSMASNTLDEQTLNLALRIYDDSGIEITPETVVNSLRSGYADFQKITSKKLSEFRDLLSNAYSSARQECGIDIPEENAGHILMKTVYRHSLPKEVLKLEKAFLDTGYKEWIVKVERGDISEYTVAIAQKAGLNIPEYVDNLVELPILETINNDKNTFANTIESSMLPEHQKRKSITRGLNSCLKALKQYHKKNTDRVVVKDSIEFFGKDGCLFGDTHITDCIIPNMHVSDWDEVSIRDENSYYSPMGFLKKIKLLHSDGYVDLDVLEDKWLSHAVNEYISQSTVSSIVYLDSLRNNEGYVIKLKNFRDDLEHLKQFSKIGDMFVSEESRGSIIAFEEWLDKEQSFAEPAL